MHCQFDSVHLAYECEFEAVKVRLYGISIRASGVVVVSSITDSGIGDHDVDAAELCYSMFEESKKVIPAACIGLAKQDALRGLRWRLDVSTDDFDSGFGEILHDAEANATGAAGDDGGLASELVSYCIIRELMT